ncbi:MAG: BsuPI-related putative proteinase inhibitor [Gemmatimonadaceae bacterium]
MTSRADHLTLPLVAALALVPLTSFAQDSLRLGIDVPREVRLGQPVPVTFRVENVAGRPLDLYLRGRTIAFDVIVERRGGGAPVWRRLAGEIIPAILQLRTLAPGETFELRAEWDQRTNRGRRVSAGVYSVRGALLTDGAPLETAAVELRILTP